MATKIGVRDLKNRASEIVREVHEKDAEYIVTLRGQPVAVLRPLAERSEQERRREEAEEAMARMDALADEIARAWSSPKSAQDLLEEQRR